MLSRIEACIPALRRHASVLLRDRQAADDLVHDCLSRALDELNTRQNDVDIRAWLFAIMHNLFSRRRHPRARLDAKTLGDTSGSSPSTAGGQETMLRGTSWCES
jgi:RNA polymerase sigma-70 factor, ECF subfamily